VVDEEMAKVFKIVMDEKVVEKKVFVTPVRGFITWGNRFLA
jgi:hypothetical protein